MEPRDTILTWLSPNDEAIRRIHAQLEYSATIGLPTLVSSWIPRLEELCKLIEVAFWASLRTNEERPTRVRIALTPQYPFQNVCAFASPADYDEAQVAKLAHVLPESGCLLVSPETDGLKIWGLSQTSAGGIDKIMAEVAAPGIVRVNIHSFRPFAVFMGRSAYIIAGSGRIDFAVYLQRILQKKLIQDNIVESHQVWHECLVLGILPSLILDQGHGGTILVVPDATGDWLGSIDPFAFKFSAPDETAKEWIRQNLPFDQQRSEMINRINSSTLSDSDKTTIFLSLAGRPWLPREAVQHISPLAKCDGAIVMTHDLKVLGFGAKIKMSEQVVATLCRLNPAPGSQDLRACPLESFGGTRHQSAVRFVSAHKNCIAIVISQDRKMSVINWREKNNCIIAIEHAEWWS